MARVAVFAGLVVDETGKPLEVVSVGNEAHYVLDDAGFLRHIPSESIDRQVLELIQEQTLENRELVVDSMLHYMGSDDLFTKATVEASINQMGDEMAQLLDHGLPDDARTWLGLMGFKVVVNVHGEIVDINTPGVGTLDE